MATDLEIAFPKLTESEINALKKFGTERAVSEGEVLFREGNRDFCFSVLLDGEVKILPKASFTLT